MSQKSFTGYESLIRGKLEDFQAKIQRRKSLFKVLARVAIRQTPTAIGVSIAYDGLQFFNNILSADGGIDDIIQSFNDTMKQAEVEFKRKHLTIKGFEETKDIVGATLNNLKPLVLVLVRNLNG